MSRSTTEAEYRGVANACSEITWIQSLLKEMHISLPHSPIIWCDNTSAVSLAANPVFHSRTKHLELDLHFIREKVLNGTIQVNYIPAVEQVAVADILTKPLQISFFHHLRNRLTLAPNHSTILCQFH